MRKKILFCINSLDAGGAEKSLVSLLYELEKYKNKLEIYLLLPDKNGLFYKQIPDYVKQIDIEKPLYYMANSYKTLINERNFHIGLLVKKLIWSIKCKWLSNAPSGIKEQKMWEHWKKHISNQLEKYDVAVGYMNGYPNYLICDKVIAKKKILWIHNEYQKLGYNIKYDAPYYEKANQIVTISDLCVRSFIQKFPKFCDKTIVLQNITSGALIRELSQKKLEQSYNNNHGFNFLSIGRLVEQKNFRLAIEAAGYIKKTRPQSEFKWRFIGKGSLKSELQNLVDENGLHEQIEFIGVTSNPYPYFRKADIFVQTSLFEGKSIVLDEAKILGKPIVVTDYNTVYDTIENEKDGLIVEQTPEAVGNAIIKLMDSRSLREQFSRNLECYRAGNSTEIKKYLKVMMPDVED